MPVMSNHLNHPGLFRSLQWLRRLNEGIRQHKGSAFARDRKTFGVVLIAFIMLSGISAVYAAEFATDADSILQKLGTLKSQSENNSGQVSKGFVMPEVSNKINVLQEINKGGSLTRNFAVIERQENAPRVNLRIEFDVNSARLRTSSFPLLHSLAQALRSQVLADASILVNGHTDSTGTDEYNLDLSYRRAQAVRDYLVSAVGISHHRLSVQGFGEGAPLVGNDTAANRQVNRRVEIERVQ